ncbi:hypothetical protein [Sinorhizobium medicae]|uniref:hypothetical protein n=1 Tax=Sinorhizobium medicae TaxID=110321 RepID=UPI000FDCD713|nr:hypothetical protein [Sinorhizobium medicae]RVO73523.1 hypothetical protein CN084_24835 [Sinorhizobium medicae]
MLYMVECGFSERALEAEWNAFYSGPKLAALLDEVPGFRRSQRFQDTAPADAPYIAIHEVVSAELLASPSYKRAGGGSFLQWQPYITNWRRTVFSGLGRLAEVRPSERLLLIDAEPRPIAGLEIQWLKTSGLGDLVPSRGLVIVPAEDAPAAREVIGASARVLEPISIQMVSRLAG